MFRYKTLQRPSEKTFQNPTALFIIRSERMQYARKGYLKNHVLKSARFLLNTPAPTGG